MNSSYAVVFRLDEAPLEIRVNDARRLRRGVTAMDRPRAHLLLAGCSSASSLSILAEKGITRGHAAREKQTHWPATRAGLPR